MSKKYVVAPTANLKNKWRFLTYHVIEYVAGELSERSLCGLKSKYGWDKKEARFMKGICDIDICANCWGVMRVDPEKFGLKFCDRIPRKWRTTTGDPMLWSHYPMFKEET